MSAGKGSGGGASRICIIGAGPCGLTALKNVLAGGLHDVVCYDESDAIGGNWVFREATDRMSVYETTHIISSKKLSAFHDFPMPPDFPVFPSQRQVLAYFQSYADAFGLRPHIRLNTRVTHARPTADAKWSVRREGAHLEPGRLPGAHCGRADPRTAQASGRHRGAHRAGNVVTALALRRNAPPYHRG